MVDLNKGEQPITETNRKSRSSPDLLSSALFAAVVAAALAVSVRMLNEDPVAKYAAEKEQAASNAAVQTVAAPTVRYSQKQVQAWLDEWFTGIVNEFGAPKLASVMQSVSGTIDRVYETTTVDRLAEYENLHRFFFTLKEEPGQVFEVSGKTGPWRQAEHDVPGSGVSPVALSQPGDLVHVIFFNMDGIATNAKLVAGFENETNGLKTAIPAFVKKEVHPTLDDLDTASHKN